MHFEASPTCLLLMFHLSCIRYIDTLGYGNQYDAW